jgi:hypothetical protein
MFKYSVKIGSSYFASGTKLDNIFLYKTHCNDIESFGKMEMSKIMRALRHFLWIR